MHAIGRHLSQTAPPRGSDHPALLARYGESRAALKNERNIPAVLKRERREGPPIQRLRQSVRFSPQARAKKLFRSQTDRLVLRWMTQYRLPSIPLQDGPEGNRASRLP